MNDADLLAELGEMEEDDDDGEDPKQEEEELLKKIDQYKKLAMKEKKAENKQKAIQYMKKMKES